MVANETDEQREERIVNDEVDRFYRSVVHYGSADIYTAVKIARAVDIDGDDLGELVEDRAKDYAVMVGELDVCYEILEYILQMARNKISEVTGYDFLDDFNGGTEICTYGNYMCSQYDYSEKAVKDLKSHLTNASEDEKEELKQDKFVMYLVNDLGISEVFPEVE
ncbi:MAG: hypothetical protein WC998_09605 [Candidatus Paceibacterota bacterium]|jgi:phage FluMu gp28-like protein